MLSISKFYLNAIIGGAVGAVLGGLVGYLFDNWPHIQEYRFLSRLQFLWEGWVTTEWDRLDSLLDEVIEDCVGLPALITPTISCQVCHGLIYDTPHREQATGDWQVRIGRGFDMRFEDSSCPYPRICDWVISAMHGCSSCQIVVDAMSVYSPEIFKGYMPQSDDLGLGSIHIRAMANQGKPLGIGICRPWIPWQSEREEYVEVFTEVGINTYRYCFLFDADRTS